jgi:hypothetical protein
MEVEKGIILNQLKMKLKEFLPFDKEIHSILSLK